MKVAKIFPVAPLGTAAHLSALTIIVLPILVILIAMTLGEIDDPKGIVIMVSAVVVPILGLLLLMRRREVSFDGETMTIKAAFYTRRLARSEIDLEKARVVNLNERMELRPLLRTNGFSLPGFHAGHYRTRDLARAFCLLTERDRVLLLPERSGKLVLLSLERPRLLLDALQA